MTQMTPRTMNSTSVVTQHAIHSKKSMVASHPKTIRRIENYNLDEFPDGVTLYSYSDSVHSLEDTFKNEYKDLINKLLTTLHIQSTIKCPQFNARLKERLNASQHSSSD
jgi:hypothetical protein